MCCYCDNQSVVEVGTVRTLQWHIAMLRCLFFLEAKFNLALTTVHVSGVDNGAVDAVSRNELDVFFCLCPQAQQTAKPMSGDLIRRLVLNEWGTSDTWKTWLKALSTPH